MGDLQKKLNEFQAHSKSSYVEIMKILEDNYCWKCPMRSTSDQSRCREVHTGRVLQEALEKGIINHLKNEEVPCVEAEALVTRMTKKKIKKQGGKQREKIIIMKIKSEECPDLALSSWIKVKINPKRALAGDKILIPEKALEHPLLGAYALVAGVPFQIAQVKRTYHENNFWYVEIENGGIISLESIFSVLVKVFEDEDSLSVD